MNAVEPLPLREPVPGLAECGAVAFTTTRAAGDYGLGDATPSPENLARWHALQQEFAPVAPRFASARQVHGATILEHGDGVAGWTRADGADGHLSFSRGIACAVTVADCVPVFMAHPSGAIAMLHAGWRGTAAGILAKGVERMRAGGLQPADLRLHLGPAICGRCYVVGPDVFEQLTGWATTRARNVDLRALLAEQAKAAGVAKVTVSAYCTRCDNDRFYSHRAGDAGRQLSVLIAPS